MPRHVCAGLRRAVGSQFFPSILWRQGPLLLLWLHSKLAGPWVPRWSPSHMIDMLKLQDYIISFDFVRGFQVLNLRHQACTESTFTLWVTSLALGLPVFTGSKPLRFFWEKSPPLRWENGLAHQCMDIGVISSWDRWPYLVQHLFVFH